MLGNLHNSQKRVDGVFNDYRKTSNKLGTIASVILRNLHNSHKRVDGVFNDYRKTSNKLGTGDKRTTSVER